MNGITVEVDFLHYLRGPGASILWCLMLDEAPYSAAALARACDYSDKPVRQALAGLAQAGIVRQDREGWQIDPSFRRRLSTALKRAGGVLPVERSPAEESSPGGGSPQEGRDRSARKISTGEKGKDMPAGSFDRPVETPAPVDAPPVEAPAWRPVDSPGVPTGRTVPDSGDSTRSSKLQNTQRSVGLSVVGQEHYPTTDPDNTGGDQGKTPQPETAAQLAWRWYYLVREGEGDPDSLAAGRLALDHPPPTPYLALAETWPGVKVEHRATMRACLDANWPGERLAQEWAPYYPAMTVDLFRVLLALHVRAPEVLDQLSFVEAPSQQVQPAAWLAI